MIDSREACKLLASYGAEFTYNKYYNSPLRMSTDLYGWSLDRAVLLKQIPVVQFLLDTFPNVNVCQVHRILFWVSFLAQYLWKECIGYCIQAPQCCCSRRRNEEMWEGYYFEWWEYNDALWGIMLFFLCAIVLLTKREFMISSTFFWVRVGDYKKGVQQLDCLRGRREILEGVIVQ